MTIFAMAVLLSAILAGVYLVIYCHQPAQTAKSVVKTTCVLLLVGAAIVAKAPAYVIVALASCAAGDYLLSLDTSRSFVLGVGAFALGHVFFILAFVTMPDADLALISAMPRAVITAILIMFAVVMGWVLAPRAGALRWAVLAYIPVIVGMGVSSLALPDINTYLLVFIGVGLFIFSDTVLALQKFVWAKEAVFGQMAPFLVWPAYWMALIFILTGVIT